MKAKHGLRSLKTYINVALLCIQQVSRHNILYRDRVSQGEEILCRDREFNVATELPETVSRQSISYVATKSSKT